MTKAPDAKIGKHFSVTFGLCFLSSYRIFISIICFLLLKRVVLLIAFKRTFVIVVNNRWRK